MERLKLIVDGKEIATRYVGDRLVWENLKFLEEINQCFAYFATDKIFIYTNYYRFTETYRVKKIEFDGVEMIGFKKFENQSSQYVITFTDSAALDSFKKKVGLNNQDNKYNVTLKLYGR